MTSERRIKLTTTWYAVYCYLNAASYALIVAQFLRLIVSRDQIATEFIPQLLMKTGQFESSEGLEQALPPDKVLIICLLIALLFAVFATVAAWLPRAPKTKAYWIVHLINALLGAGSCIFTPICLWLLIQLFHKDVIAHYQSQTLPESQP